MRVTRAYIAGFGTAGVETGTAVLQGDALLEFGGGGQISTINGEVQLVGANARIADAGTLATNSALIGLATVAGNLWLQNGASIGPTSGGLSITGTGRVALDAPFIGGGSGGSSLTIGGVLTNTSTDGNNDGYVTLTATQAFAGLAVVQSATV